MLRQQRSLELYPYSHINLKPHSPRNKHGSHVSSTVEKKKKTFLPQKCDYAQLADDFKGNEYEPRAPMGLIAEEHSLNL